MLNINKEAHFSTCRFFSPESTKSKAIVTATRKREQRRGNDKREEIVVGKVHWCGKKEVSKEIVQKETLKLDKNDEAWMA